MDLASTVIVHEGEHRMARTSATDAGADSDCRPRIVVTRVATRRTGAERVRQRYGAREAGATSPRPGTTSRTTAGRQDARQRCHQGRRSSSASPRRLRLHQGQYTDPPRSGSGKQRDLPRRSSTTSTRTAASRAASWCPSSRSTCPLTSTSRSSRTARRSRRTTTCSRSSERSSTLGRRADSASRSSRSGVLLTFDLDQAMIDKSPPGYIVTPGRPRRNAACGVLVELLEEAEHVRRQEGRGARSDTSRRAIVNEARSCPT